MTNEQLFRQIMNKKKELEKDREEKLRAEGQLKAFSSQLEKEYGCQTEEEGTELLQEIEEEIKKIKSDMEKLYDSYTKLYS